MQEILKNKKNAIIASIIAMILWGSAIPLIKTTYLYLNISADDTGAKILVAGLRFFMAGLLSFLYYFLFNRKTKGNKKIEFKIILLFALVQTFLQYLFYYIGLSNTQGSKASIIQSSNAFFSVIISVVLISDEHLNTRKILALLLGSLGIIFVNINGLEKFSFKLTGEGFVIVSTFFGALANVFLKKYGKDYDSFILTASQFTLGSIGLIIIGILTKRTNFNFDLGLLLLLGYGAFISATAFCLWTLVLKYHSSSEFSVYKLFIPIFGTIFSIIVLGEEFTMKIVVGLVLVLLASAILNSKKVKIGKIL